MTFPEPGTTLTHLFVVGDLGRATRWYRDVLGAEVVGEYGGTSCVLPLRRHVAAPRDVRTTDGGQARRPGPSLQT